MSQISQIRKCYSCGATLQCEDPNKEGYVKRETLENASQNFLFCDKCFENERYHSTSHEPFVDDDFLTMLEDAKKTGSLLVYVVNLFSFEASFSSKINEVIKDMNILIVANKFDLLPEGTTKESAIDYMRHRFKVSGLIIDPERIMVSNAFSDATAREVMSRIYELKGNKNVYILGSELAGKTTLVSSFLRVFSNLSDGTIVTHNYKNTNYRIMEIPMTKSSKMFVLPGISNSNSILSICDKSELKQIYLFKPVEKRIINLSKGEAFFIGGLAFLEMIDGEKTKIECYFHENVQIKKVPLKKSEDLFFKKISKKAISPSIKAIHCPKDMDVYEIKITESNVRDIGIQGLGWITLKANGQTLRLNVPKSISVYSSRTKVANY